MCILGREGLGWCKRVAGFLLALFLGGAEGAVELAGSGFSSSSFSTFVLQWVGVCLVGLSNLTYGLASLVDKMPGSSLLSWRVAWCMHGRYQSVMETSFCI